MTTRLLFFIFTCTSVAGACQVNFRQGVIVNNDGDTVRGFIDHKEWSKNPEEIVFRKAMEAPSENLKVHDIRYFQVESDAFLRYAGAISMDVNTFRVVSTPTFPQKTDTVWFKIITAGSPLSLYVYRDELKSRFFVRFEHDLPEELINRTYPKGGDDDRYMVLDDRYKYHLKSMALRAGRMDQKVRFIIEKSTYGTRSLEEIVRRINEPNVKYRHKNPAHLAIGGGFNFVHLRVPVSYVGHVQRSTKPAAYFSLVYDIPGNSDVGKLIFRAELSVTAAAVLAAQGGQDSTYTQISTQQTTFTASPQLLYNFYRSKNIKLYASGGVRFNYSQYSAQVGYSPLGTNLFPFWLAGNLQVGVLYKKRFEFMAAFSPQIGQMVSNFEFWENAVDHTRFGINYHLGKR